MPLPQPAQRWLHELTDIDFTPWVTKAWQRNPSLQGALARLQAARAQQVISGSVRLPSVDMRASGSRSRSNSGNAEYYANSFALNASVNWELDLWRRLEARHRAGIAEAAAATADYAGARLLLAADVVKAWLRWQEAQLQLENEKRKRESFSHTLEVIEQRYRLGLSEALDVYLARENLATAEAKLVGREIQQQSAESILTALLGERPVMEEVPEALPVLNEEIPAQIDARALARRPDIHAAQQRLLASSARLRDQQRNLLPALRLTGSGGTLSNEFKNLLDLDYLVWSIAAGLTQPLFQGGRLRAERQLAQADLRQLIAQYAQTILTAVKEFQTALIADPLYARQETFQTQAVTEARAAAELALTNYATGITDIETLLNAQRRSFNAESLRLTTHLNRLLNRIDLHLAVGGDYILESLNTSNENIP